MKNVRVASAAIAHYVLKQEDAAKGVCIGYDTRFGSKSFAKVVADVLTSAGIPVQLSNAHYAYSRVVLCCSRTRRGGWRHDHVQP